MTREALARDLMRDELLTVKASMSVQDLAEFLVANEISGAPVEDDDGRLVGVVSTADLAAAAAGGSAIGVDRSSSDFYVHAWEEQIAAVEMPRFHIENGGLQVGDIMTRSLYSVADDVPVSEVARAMLSGHVHRLLVTRGESVVGIVTTSDLIGLLTREG